jgi:hypothetical protein
MMSRILKSGKASVLVLMIGLAACSAVTAQNRSSSASETQVTQQRADSQLKSTSSASGVPPYRVDSLVAKMPDCKGELCPSITFKKLSFEGHERFNAFLVRSLLGVALLDTSKVKTFAELASQFWKTAEDRYEIVLGAEVRRATPSVIVIELQSYLYSGGAHGMSTMQYVNWVPKTDKILTLNDMVLRGRMKAFEGALKKQYEKWLDTNEFAQTDKADYSKMWPFQFSDNAALMQDGIAVTFDHYVLGPYALGMPTIVVPYAELKGIIKSGLLAKIHN